MGIPEPAARGYGNTYGDPTKGANGQAAPEEATNLAAVGKAHMSVLKAAFICDIVRCGTLLWAPGTNHVGFRGLYPGSTTTVYQHHPQSHRIGTPDTTASSSLTSLNASAQFLFAVQLWFFKQMADNIKEWKTSYDGFGNSLLDYTVVPYVTEVARNRPRAEPDAGDDHRRQEPRLRAQPLPGGQLHVQSVLGLDRAFGGSHVDRGAVRRAGQHPLGALGQAGIAQRFVVASFAFSPVVGIELG